MRQEAVIVLGLDQGNLPQGAQAAAASIGKIGQAGQVSARQTAAAMRQLPAQFTDIATQLAGGANPLLVLLQQGGQIKDSFGGIGAALRGVASAISPATLVLGGVAAAVGTLATAAFQGAKESAELRDTLILTGNAAGLTEDRLSDLAQTIQQSTGQTLGQSRELIVQLAATGQVTQDVLESTAEVVARIADLSGKSASEIATRFAQQLRDPARFAAELNRQYNFLDEATARRIRALTDEGRAVEAAKLTNESLTDALRGQRDQLGTLERAWDSLTKSISEAWDAIKRIGREPTVQQAITASRSRLEELRAQLSDNRARGRGESAVGGQAPFNRGLREQIAAEEERLAALEERARFEQRAADAAADRASQSGRVNSILDPSGDAAQRARELARFLEEQRKLSVLSPVLRDALGNYRTDVGPAQTEAETDRLKRYEEVLAGLPEVIEPVITAQDQLRQSFLRSEKDAYLEIDKFLADQAERAQQELDRIKQRAQDNVQDAFGDTISRALSGDFDSILDLWKALLARMVAEALSADLAAALFGKGQGGNLSGLLGSIFGAVSGLFGGGRATGGPVSRGRIYEVNETGGPGELLNVAGRQYLLAAQSGVVTPNSGGGGMGATHVTNYIDSRTDRAEITQMIARAMAQTQQSMWQQMRARGVV